jgi:hypothetical protein
MSRGWINCKGRWYKNGLPTGEDLRTVIINDMESKGAQQTTGIYPRGLLTDMSRKYKMSVSGVRKLWTGYCSRNTVVPLPHSGGPPRKLDEHDIQYVQALKTEKPSMSLKEVQSKLQTNSGKDVSVMTISTSIRKRLTNGEWTRKVMMRPAAERFTDYNRRYTLAFLNVIQTRDPFRLKFMDEAGFTMPTDANRKRGHSPVGQRCIEVQKYAKSPNLTLNLLVGIRGVLHFNFVQGASNTQEFLQFFDDAGQSMFEDGYPVLQPGDTVIVDNATIHRFQAGRLLGLYFQNIGVELLYLPTYSPDMNAAEYVFNHIRTLMQQELYSTMAIANIRLALSRILGDVTVTDCYGFYKKLGYLQV